MATQKPISTISYNSESFLREKLESWYDAHIIQAYQYIVHLGEDGDKDHIHVRIEPNKKLDPMELTSQLQEYRFGDSKPLGVRPWRPSKEEDWFLYAVHDEDYLKLKYSSDKGEKLPYDWHDIRVSPLYDLETAFVRAKASQLHSTSNMLTRLQRGESPVSLIQQGENAYLTNALMKVLSDTDYSRLQREFASLEDLYFKLVQAVTDAGFSVEHTSDGSVFLAPLCPSEDGETN